jgi:hypothetical protein
VGDKKIVGNPLYILLQKLLHLLQEGGAWFYVTADAPNISLNDR